MVVQAVGFQEVDDVELVLLATPRVLHAEVKPLRVSARVDIWFQDEVVLILVPERQAK